MTDIIDQAADTEALWREASQKLRHPAGPTPNGACHFCGETVTEPLRWCDENCRDDWQARQPRSTPR
ncbi:MAG: hypothetical protein REI94_10175 [Moraxellaceae bacterium]|nr:hypothetical protein [Moraxellaceae bacterium]